MTYRRSRWRWKRLLLVPATIAIAMVALGEPLYADQPAPDRAFEVWAVDQSDSVAGGGGLLYVWNGADLWTNASGAEPEVIDLAAASAEAGCDVGTRPHMILPNSSDPTTHAIIANVGSGDVFFVETASRAIVGCVDVSGAGAGDAHAALAAPNDELVLVDDAGHAGESGFLHKIQTDYAANAFTLVETLPLAPFEAQVGTAAVRPICHEFTADSRFAYVTLAGGGLLVVDVGSADGTTPMSVAHVYPADTVPGIGCGAFRLPDGDMISNGESGASGGDDFLFRFDTSGATGGIFPDPAVVELPGDDTHGVALCSDRHGSLFALTTMRVSNDTVAVDLGSHSVRGAQSMARGWSPDPKPDVSGIVGDRMFVTLRGPKPLTAIGSLQDAARTPGVAVLTVHPNCRGTHWTPKDLASMADPDRTTTLDDGTTVTAADPHGLAIVLR